MEDKLVTDRVGAVIGTGSKVAYGQREGNTAKTVTGKVIATYSGRDERIMPGLTVPWVEILSEYGRTARRMTSQVVVYG